MSSVAASARQRRPDLPGQLDSDFFAPLPPPARTQRALAFRDGGRQPMFQRICYDYNPDGTCNVWNNAPRDRRSRAAERQAELRLSALDREINRLPDNTRIDDMRGRQVKNTWNNTRWYIDPEGTPYGNPGAGAVIIRDGRAAVRMELGDLLRRQAASRGHQNYQFLHDSPGHASPQGQRFTADMQFQHMANPRTRDTPYNVNSLYFRDEERDATRRAETVARAIGAAFEYPRRRRGY